MIAIRWVMSLGLAAVVTIALFYFMQALIATGGELEQRVNVIRVVDATMPEIVMEVVREVERPEEIQQLDNPPPEVPNRDINMSGDNNLNISRDVVNVDLDMNIGSAGLGATDGEMLPLVNIQPTYPTRAAQRGIEGWAQVSFTVTETGGVRDVFVVDAEPAGMFDQASIRAA
ncbi:MAG: TonB family protein, partial [Pseudohongiella sp.]|nr:TonB family protein [Pseudohongiella sp.]